MVSLTLKARIKGEVRKHLLKASPIAPIFSEMYDNTFMYHSKTATLKLDGCQSDQRSSKTTGHFSRQGNKGYIDFPG